ncbi:MAG: GNAT family N-acetyltransferase [Acidobacteriota bacterium]
MKTTQRILILDGHTNQALACVRSLGLAGYKVLVASHRPSPLGSWSRYCKGSFRLAEQSVEVFAAMREWARREGVEIVLPLTERSCMLCNAERTQWEAIGIKVGCGTDEMLQNAFDKGRTILRAKECGLRIPVTQFPTSLAECLTAIEKVGFPCVVKPRWSSAWNGASVSANLGPAYLDSSHGLEELLLERNQGNDWPLIQEFVPGQGKGVFALCDQGRAVALFAHERLRETRPTGSGSSLRRSIPLEPRLRDPAERLLAKLKWHGPAMVEFKDDGKEAPCLMEVNGRFWGSLQLGIDAGVDFPLLWLSILNGQPMEPLTHYEEGLTLRWLWGDVKRFAWILRGTPPGYAAAYPTVYEGLRDLLGPQPHGTRLEAWRMRDPWPAVGELTGGVKEFLDWTTPMWLKPNSRRKESDNGDQGRAMTPKFLEKNHMGTRVLIRDATEQEVCGWDNLVTRFDNCRVVHKMAWLRSLEASCVNGKPLFLIYEKEGEIVACLPGFLVKVGFLRLFGSPLPGWQTLSMGPVFDPDRISTEELTIPLIKYLEEHHGVHHFELLTGGLDHRMMEALRFTRKPSPSYCVPMFPGDENRVLKSFKDSARRNVKRAIKLGLVVKFEDDESFVDEHYDQLVEVYNRGGNMIPFTKKRALEFFRHMKASGNLVAISVSLPDGGPCIATGTFTIEGRELVLWMWAHRTRYRWYRPTELMTWTVMQKAMAAGCDNFDLMGRGEFKPKLGAELNESRSCWVWSRYSWLTKMRLLAGRGYKWQQAFRGRRAQRSLLNRLSAEGPVETAAAQADALPALVSTGKKDNRSSAEESMPLVPSILVNRSSSSAEVWQQKASLRSAKDSSRVEELLPRPEIMEQMNRGAWKQG